MTESGRKPGRPPKRKEDVRATDLRIPVTEAEKGKVQRAAALDGDGTMAAWARSVLLEAAEKRLKKRSK